MEFETKILKGDLCGGRKIIELGLLNFSAVRILNVMYFPTTVANESVGTAYSETTDECTSMITSLVGKRFLFL